MMPEECHIALKEWAVTVQALAQGKQILLLRKGGIHESSKDFRVQHPDFLLYPTFEHQREELLQPESHPAFRDLLAQSRPKDEIVFTHFAHLEELIEISEQDKVDDLSPHHIWTKAYAQSRLHWKPMLPLTVMLLRIYRMGEPVSVRYLPEYSGCTSWVGILHDVPLGQLEPVLSDDEFRLRVDEIKGSLGLAVGAA